MSNLYVYSFEEVLSLSDDEQQARQLLIDGGEAGNLIRRFDWAGTSLGELASWPRSLLTVTNMLLLSPVPIVLLWGEDGIMIYNDAYSVFAGNRHPQLLGSKVREGWDEISDFNDNVMRVGLGGGTLAYRDQELTLTRHGKPAPVWMNLDYSPVYDESGRPGGVIAIVVETTDRVLAERQLRSSEERFRAFTNATTDVVYRMSADWKTMQQMDGRGFLTDTDSPRVAWQEAYLLPEDIPAVQQAIDHAVATRTPFEYEHRVRRSDGEIGWTLSRAVPIFEASGHVEEWFGAASDVTERRKDQERMRLVVNELNHRVKNNLAMIQAIAKQTFRSLEDSGPQLLAFEERIMALGHANDLLTGERWTGASLKAAIRQAVKPHAPADRFAYEGADVTLSPKTALALTLSAHELATNALKYGAWSAEGRVSVSCERYGDANGQPRYRLIWQESGGPGVTAPNRRGFGSRLIERGLASEISGTVEMMFEAGGLRCVIDAPISEAD